MVDTKKALVIKHINARSLLSCFDEVRLLIKSSKPDVLCISESWLLPSMPSRFVDIEGFTVYRCDEGYGGGVCVYVRNELSVIELHLGLLYNEKIQDIWLQIQSRKFPSIIVGAMYRHPHAHVDSYDYISNSLQKASLYNKNIFLLGDLNDDQLVSNSKLKKIVDLANFHQLIDKPTRVTPNSKTLLDVIITNNSDIVISSEVTPCHLSDHDMISVKVNIGKPRKIIETKTFRSLKNYDKDTFCNNLMEQIPAFNRILDTDNVNQQVDILTSTFMTCLDSCAPIVTKKIYRPPAPWITEEIKKEMEYRDNLRKTSNLTSDNIANELYKT